MGGLRTEFPFTLPKGYIDESGMLHRSGAMRLATARDEIEPLRDRSIDGPDDPYLTILVLARVITELGSLPEIMPTDVENLFAADLAFLQDLYGIINFGDPDDVAALQASVPTTSTVTDDEPDATEAAAEPDDVATLVPDSSVDGEAAGSSRRGGRRGRIEEVGRPSAS